MRIASRLLLGGVAMSAALMSGPPTSADVVEFTDKDQWLAAVGAFSTADFVDLPANTVMTDQYAHLGVIFTEANDTVVCCNARVYLEDGATLDGNGTISLAFSEPSYWIAVDFPGDMRFELYVGERLIYESSNFGIGGIGNFGGLVTDEPFDGAILIDWVDNAIFIDDIHFGPPANDGDLDGDGDVDTTDLITLLGAWGRCAGADCIACPADLDDDCFVGPSDLITLLGNWG